MTYVIVGANGYVLNPGQVGLIMDNVVWELETNVMAPSFKGKELTLQCGDARIEGWLKGIFRKLKPWRGVKLTLLSKADWDTMERERRMVRMSVITPWRTTGNYILDVLRSHNPNLRTRC